MGFDTAFTITGPLRSPAQMLAGQQIDHHASVHDDDTATSLGLLGAPIEGPTHFSQFDPLAVAVWGDAWFSRGCISAHFQQMVIEGEQVQASLSTASGQPGARIEAHKADGSAVLVGTASLGPEHPESELDLRRAKQGDPGELFIVDRLEVGMVADDDVVSMTFDEPNGSGYPFSLAEKLDRITERHPWYTAEGAASSPWGRPIVPMEMISVLAHKSDTPWPIRSPALGLFLDLEVRLLDGPVLVERDYVAHREVVGLSQSRRTESYWTRTTLCDAESDRPVASVLLHSGVFKESYPAYPSERLEGRSG